MHIPDELSDVLAAAPEVEQGVRESVRRFAPWLEASGMPFFPGFTDHGPAHLSRVLGTATWLIADRAWRVVTPQDAGSLILAVLLHDAAMHLTEDGFRALIAHSPAQPLIPELDRQSWRELWAAYLVEARHWKAADWSRVLGPDWQARGRVDLAALAAHRLENIDELSRPFIGEFIRRHHPRLAHEFARGGVPRLDRAAGDPLTLALPASCAPLVDLAGAAARSHGLPLRTTLAYLKQRHDGVRHLYGCHPTFVMALLRIADALDLHAERAPEGLLRVKTLRSTVSRGEWAAHQAITDIRYNSHDDPELIQIAAAPQSAETYQHIRRWVQMIQAELDQSWAVLGEVHGGREPYINLALRVRRITTPLDDPGFAERQGLPFLPEPAQFSVVPGEILPLLVKPLYGNEPYIGIRELMQNAIDAVNELSAAGESGARPPIDDRHPLPAQYGADVLVRVCRRDSAWPSDADAIPTHWESWVEVADRGIGMTAQTVRDYFLSIGSSFRRSLEWTTTFAPDEQPKVIRNGRFGVGVIAAFILGEELHVTTRHASEAEGVTFVAHINGDPFELRRIRCPVGTIVRIPTAAHVHQELVDSRWMWDWFALSEPVVARVVRHGLEEKRLAQRRTVPLPGSQTPPWRATETAEYGTLLWRPTRRADPPTEFFCNGIKIRDVDSALRPMFKGDPEWHVPTVSVVDRTGTLPLTLTRNELHGHASFLDDLRRDIVIDQCAWLVFQAGLPPARWSPFRAPLWFYNNFFPDMSGAHMDGSAFAVTEDSLIPLCGWHLREAKATALSAYVVPDGDPESSIIHTASRGRWPSPLAMVALSIMDELQGAQLHIMSELLMFPRPLGWQVASWSCVVPGSYWRRQKPARLFPVSVHAQFTVLDGDWLFYGSDRAAADEEVTYLRTIVPDRPTRQRQRLPAAARFHFDVDTTVRQNSLSEIWRELHLPPALAFDTRVRRAQCAGALPILTPYLERFRTMAIEEPGSEGEVEAWWRS